MSAPASVYNLEVENHHTYFVKDGQGEQTAVWVHNTCAGFSHLVPRALGSETPYGHSSLKYMSEFRHTDLHRRLAIFLQGDPLCKKGGYTMFPCKGNPGSKICDIFSPAEREAALTNFYKTYCNGRYFKQFLSELATAKANLWW